MVQYAPAFYLNQKRLPDNKRMNRSRTCGRVLLLACLFFRLGYPDRSVGKSMHTPEKKAEYQFGLGRLLAGTALAALPFAIFPTFGRPGTVVAILIATCCFVIALLAKSHQVRAIGRLVASGLIGCFFGLLLSPVSYRPIEQAQFVILFVIAGLVAGALWAFPAYCEYETHLREQDAKAVTEDSMLTARKSDRTKE
jgi:hypothetical protein